MNWSWVGFVLALAVLVTPLAYCEMNSSIARETRKQACEQALADRGERVGTWGCN